VAVGYADMYLLKKVIEEVGTTDDVVLLSTGLNSAEQPPRYKGDYAEPEKYKTPAQLRKEAGW